MEKIFDARNLTSLSPICSLDRQKRLWIQPPVKEKKAPQTIQPAEKFIPRSRMQRPIEAEVDPRSKIQPTRYPHGQEPFVKQRILQHEQELDRKHGVFSEEFQGNGVYQDVVSAKIHLSQGLLRLVLKDEAGQSTYDVHFGKGTQQYAPIQLNSSERSKIIVRRFSKISGRGQKSNLQVMRTALELLWHAHTPTPEDEFSENHVIANWITALHHTLERSR